MHLLPLNAAPNISIPLLLPRSYSSARVLIILIVALSPKPDIIHFQLSGVVLCASGLWTYYTHYSLLVLMETVTYAVITWLLVATGALVMAGGILGCAGVHLESEAMVGAVS